LEASESMKAYATDKVSRLAKHFHGPTVATVTFSLVRRLQRIDLNIHAGGENYLGHEEQEDMYASIDLVVDKIRHQLRHTKDAHAQRRRDATVTPGE